MSDWVEDYFRAADTMALDELEAFHSEDVSLTFGNGDTVHGRDRWRETISTFFTTIAAVRHTLVNVWRVNDDVIVDSRVDYTRLDGDVVAVSAVTMLHRRDGLVDNVKIVVDLAPVYAQPMAA